MKKLLFPLLVLCIAACTSQRHELHVITTDDVHGAWFDSSYVGAGVRPSLMAVNCYVDSIRKAVGRKNVLLLDAGDCLQGDNAAYYFNYADTIEPHLYPRIVSYMGYDAVTVGNHDVETGHKVYDRVTDELAQKGIPFFAGNALKLDGTAYWPEYKLFRRAGLKVLVLGYTNANMAAWLDESLWSGMQFVSLVPFVQERVDKIKALTHPDITIVCVHSGVGEGDGTVLESQGLDLFRSLRGVDLLVTAHDHRPRIEKTDSIILVNAGSKARWFTHSVITLDKGGKTLAASLVKVDASKADPEMRERFKSDYLKVRDFTLRKVGSISEDMRTRDAFKGRCFYMDFIHCVELASSGADIAFAAPLSFNAVIPAGELVYNDLFSIYPYENSLYTLSLSGQEIRDYLEYSYDHWIKTLIGDGHVFRISRQQNLRYSGSSWSFDYPSFNFDSASGIDYSVDVTKPYGRRVKIACLADGRPFEKDKRYMVAMTSYRAAGGGDLLFKGAGLSREELSKRLVSRGPELRDLVYGLISSEGMLTPASLKGLGDWHFVPEREASKAIERDMSLLFP